MDRLRMCKNRCSAGVRQTSFPQKDFGRYVRAALVFLGGTGEISLGIV